MDIKELISLQNSKAEVVRNMQAIIDAAAGRELTRSQERDFTSLEARSKDLSTKIDEAIRALDAGSQETDEKPNLYRETEYQMMNGVQARSGLQLLGREQRMSDLFGTTQKANELRFDRWLRGVVTGNWSGAEAELHEARDMSIGVLGGGGYTVPESMALNIIDKVRNAAQVMQAGAQTVPMSSSKMKIGRLAGDPTAAWKQENADSTASDMVFEGVELNAHTLIARTKASVELVEDTVGLDVESSIAAALALELDRACLLGTGLNDQPTGIFSQAGVTITELGAGDGEAPDYADISKAVERRQTANHNPTAMIAAPRSFGVFDRLVDLNGQPVKPFASYEKLNKYPTSQVPVNLTVGNSNDCSLIFIGDFRKALIGLRTALTIEVSRIASDAAGSAYSRLQVWVRAYLRADLGLAHPAAFEVLSGVRS